MPALIRNFSKFNAIVLFAGAITLALFYSMQLLIMAETGIPAVKERPIMPDINMPEIVLTPNRETPRPEKVDEPPSVPEYEFVPDSEGPPISLGPVLPKDVPVDTGDYSLLGPADGNAMPIAQIQPQYPARAIEREIEGFVIVEFDVSETGGVINPEILVSEPDGIFDRASIRALERWRYQPKLVDGKAVPMRSLQTKFNFSLRE